MSHLSPPPVQPTQNSCTINETVPQMNLIISLMKEKIGQLHPKISAGRQRRLIETAILGGAVAWNRASIWSLTGSTEALEKQMSDLSSQNLIVTQSMNTLITQNNAIYHAVDRHAQIIRDFGRKLDCNSQQVLISRLFMPHGFLLLPIWFCQSCRQCTSGKNYPGSPPCYRCYQGANEASCYQKYSILAGSNFNIRAWKVFTARSRIRPISYRIRSDDLPKDYTREICSPDENPNDTHKKKWHLCPLRSPRCSGL